jgi:hypothetical protein
LLQLGFADRLLGHLLRRLRAVGLYHRALLVVAADHGVSFRPGQRRRGFRESNLDDVVFMPLLVKRPGQQAGRVVDEPAQTVDILPTIADVLGVKIPWQLDGTSLFEARERERFLLVGDHRRFTADPKALAARRQESLRRQIALFGSGLYGIGPNPALLGRRLDELTLQAAGEARATLDQAEELEAVDLASEEIPARLTGTISGDANAGRSLAIALGGRIVAVGRSYSSGGAERFSVLVPESSLRQGTNHVELLWVQPGPVLVRLST